MIGDAASDIFTVTSSGLNIVQDGTMRDAAGAVEIRDGVAVSDAVTVSGTLRIGDSAGNAVFNVIDDDAVISASTLMNEANDLYVEGDIEIGGNLSIDQDVTIIGVIFSDDYTQIMSRLTTTDDLDVRGEIFDGAGTDIDIDDYLSITGKSPLPPFAKGET